MIFYTVIATGKHHLCIIPSLPVQVISAWKPQYHQRELHVPCVADHLGTGSNRPGTLLLRVGELRRACIEHIEIALCSQKDNPDVDFSELFKEMFLDMAGEGFKPRGVCRKRLQMGLAALGHTTAGSHGVNPFQMAPMMFQGPMDLGRHLDKGLLSNDGHQQLLLPRGPNI